ncbi:hypothetical protein Tco_1112504 [Tanacetum coccineum]|uniref:Uncharacterized protein n=1 Tax=Tanacetum coccineum TaxID=301880 RepID=A0ABQ5IQT9_9ASTR
MDDPNIIMEEYIRLEEEKAHRRGKVYNWETATYGKIWYDEDVHDLRSIETEFPAIVFDGALTSEVTLSCEPTASPLNDHKIDFRTSFNKSDDEDYMVIYDENSFSYKIISVNDLKTVYNDARTSKSEHLTEPIPTPQHIDEFNLIDETSLSECDEENVLYFNDLFNIIHPDDLKSEKDNDDNDIDIIQSSEDYDSTTAALIRGINGVITLSEEYNEGIRHREPGVHEMSDTEMGLDVADTLCFQLGGVRRRVTWRHFILALGLHTEQEMTEAWFGAYWDGSDRAPEKGRKSGARLSGGHFIRRLAMHFGLVSDEGLRGLQPRGLERKSCCAGAHEAGLAVEEAALASEPEVSYFDDLDFFKDFENEFLAIVYNDALMSKSDFLTEPNLSPQHIDKFNLKDETSLSECDEEEQNVLYFNDLFPFNVIYPDDLKLDTDNANDEIDIEQPLGDMSVIPLPNDHTAYPRVWDTAY